MSLLISGKRGTIHRNTTLWRDSHMFGLFAELPASNCLPIACQLKSESLAGRRFCKCASIVNKNWINLSGYEKTWQQTKLAVGESSCLIKCRKLATNQHFTSLPDLTWMQKVFSSHEQRLSIRKNSLCNLQWRWKINPAFIQRWVCIADRVGYDTEQHHVSWTNDFCFFLQNYLSSVYCMMDDNLATIWPFGYSVF